MVALYQRLPLFVLGSSQEKPVLQRRGGSF